MLLKDISFIVPVYNRPSEIDELLNSFSNLNGSNDFEIVIVEDGSINKCDHILKKYNDLNISYYFKKNSGPGDSRNFGMRVAKGKYFVILDSDCLLPKNYTKILIENLSKNYTDCFGGVDASHESFSSFQKAVSFSMTSFITTGHLRGGKMSKGFQPRSFNMGISKNAFNRSKGFGNIHPGEDPDLSIRLENLGINTSLYSNLKVFHKRRVSISSFFNQIYKFGLARGILNARYPQTKKMIYWLPSIFSGFFITSLYLIIFNINYPIFLFLTYFVSVFLLSMIKHNLFVGFLSVVTTIVQFMAYGYGFLKSTSMIKVLSNKKIESIFPKMFFS